MAYSKVILNGTTIMDVTQDTVNASNLLSGETATRKDGVGIVGEASAGTQYPYHLGGYDTLAWGIITARDNHFRVDFTSSGPSVSPGMRSFRDINLSNTWFTINAGDTYEIEFYNVENPSNITWNSNAKRVNTSTSLSYGIGNGTHLDGAVVSGTQVNTENIGCWFLWCGSTVANSYLAFDMSIKINGTRIL